MKSVNKPFADMQKKTLESLEPLQNMNAVAAEAFERITRKNYDLMGDLVDYAVAQIKTFANTTNLLEAYEQRMAETKAFAEKLNARTAQYVALAGELGLNTYRHQTTTPKNQHPWYFISNTAARYLSIHPLKPLPSPVSPLHHTPGT